MDGDVTFLNNLALSMDRALIAGQGNVSCFDRDPIILRDIAKRLTAYMEADQRRKKMIEVLTSLGVE